MALRLEIITDSKILPKSYWLFCFGFLSPMCSIIGSHVMFHWVVGHCFLFWFFLELFLVLDWGWCLTLLFFLVFPSFTVSWVVFVLFNIIYVCFDRSCAIRVHDEWFFTSSICFYKYVQAPVRGEEGMMLFFVCCNPNCGHW